MAMQQAVQRSYTADNDGSFNPSSALIGFDKAQRLLLLGGGCLLIVFIFGVILCRLDVSAGRKRRARAQSFQQVES